MKQSDFFYRAFVAYKKQLDDSKECTAERHAVAVACTESDIVRVTRNICSVENDWIEAVEKGLVHIGKAIEENRQFILSVGEVVPIEKVKRVSKDSVIHLAQHSNLISKKPLEGDDLIPEELYTVERLNDFAVYENRFLYMLLKYLDSFVGSRYEKILELATTYNGSLSMQKRIESHKRRLSLDITLSDIRKDDEFLRQEEQLRQIISRIEPLIETIIFYLETPLMHEVAKAPPLKPPITKTNVLKMNENFSGAMDLFDFVSAYEKQGYTVESREDRFSPFDKGMADDFSDLVMLTSFLTYRYGLEQDAYLRRDYEIEEQARREAEEQRLIAQLAELKQRIVEKSIDPIEYMLMLEKRNKTLELERHVQKTLKAESIKLRFEADQLRGNVKTLTARLQQKQAEINSLIRKHNKELADIRMSHREEIAAQNALHHAKLEELRKEQACRIEEIRAEAMQSIEDYKLAHKEEMDAKDARALELVEQIDRERQGFEERATEQMSKHRQEINRLDQRFDELTAQYDQLNEEHTALIDSNALTEAQLHGLKRQYNLPDEGDYTSKEAFDQLEHQYIMFSKFIKSQWSKSKRQIRRDAFKTIFQKYSTQEEED